MLWIQQKCLCYKEEVWPSALLSEHPSFCAVSAQVLMKRYPSECWAKTKVVQTLCPTLPGPGPISVPVQTLAWGLSWGRWFRVSVVPAVPNWSSGWSVAPLKRRVWSWYDLVELNKPLWGQSKRPIYKAWGKDEMTLSSLLQETSDYPTEWKHWRKKPWHQT